MTSHARKLLEKSERAIRAARKLLSAGDADFAGARTYYAMFYVAEALLAEKGMQFRKHGGVHAAFAEHFVKSGLFDSKFHRWLLDAFDKRIQADYGVEATVTVQDVENMIVQAED